MAKNISRRTLLAAAAGTASAGLSVPFLARHGFAQSRTKITIINTGSNSVQTMQALLKQQGYLEEFGIDATTLNVSDGTKTLASLIGGEVDVAMLSGLPPILPAIEKGAQIKVLAGGLLRSNSILYSGRPEIKSVKDLKGRTIGVGAIGAVLHSLTVMLLRKHGVDPATVTFVNIGAAPDIFKAVAARTIDAGPAQVEFLEDAKKNNINALEFGSFGEQLPDYSDQGSYSGDQIIARKRDALVRTLAAYGKLYRFVSTPGSKDAYLEARKAAMGSNADMVGGVLLWEFIQKYKPYPQNLEVSEARVRVMQEVSIEGGLQKSVFPYERVADMSLARDAVKLLGGPIAGVD